MTIYDRNDRMVKKTFIFQPVATGCASGGKWWEFHIKKPHPTEQCRQGNLNYVNIVYIKMVIHQNQLWFLVLPSLHQIVVKLHPVPY